MEPEGLMGLGVLTLTYLTAFKKSRRALLTSAGRSIGTECPARMWLGRSPPANPPNSP
jgi:hypothetical protein